MQRIGAVSPVSGIHLLPATDACIESFQWLAEEVRQADGQAVVMHVDGFEGQSNDSIVELFQSERKSEYAVLDEQLLAMEERLKSDSPVDVMATIQDELAKVKRRYSEIVNIDYFGSYEGTTTAARLDKITLLLFPDATLHLKSLLLK